MPTHAPAPPITPRASEVNQDHVACPHPLTPPPEVDETLVAESTSTRPRQDVERLRPRHLVNDNTAAGMSLRQEDIMYALAEEFQDKERTDGPLPLPLSLPMDVDDVDGEVVVDDAGAKDSRAMTYEEDTMVNLAESGSDQPMASPPSTESVAASSPRNGDGHTLPSPPPEATSEVKSRGFADRPGVTSIDQELDWTSSSSNPAWECTQRRRRPQYPSATLKPYSKFKGTQQSDRQIYNVEVTILTVDIEQSTLSGYLQICGLTPDHPTLTTFFTGEIIGGPEQKYSFRTRDASWGASDKTDLTHWARFPAWRPLSLQAKRNINFAYPPNHEEWWQQEHVFMRWKEHFLVPDYKLKSIQGASFEGFYYICFNQVQGSVSGIYFHSKSEKYQQLELKHEGKQGVWGRGVCPAVEFR